jgi:hypothetical protein
MIRYQAIFYLPPVGLWVLAIALARASGGPVERVRALFDWRSLPGALALGFGGGLLLAILAQGLIELLAYGRPFHSLLASFEYNVTSGLAPVEFGAEPFDWFLRESPSWLGLTTGVLTLLGLSAGVRGPSSGAWRLVAVTGLAMLLALSALPHKEERFMSQVVPLLTLLGAQGALLVGRFVTRWKAPTPSPSPLRGRGEQGDRREAEGGHEAQIGWDESGPGRPGLLPLSLARGRGLGGGGLLAVALLVLAASPMLLASWRLDLTSNVGYVAGVKRAAELKPGGTLGTIPWLVARPYAGTRLTLERMDRNVWSRRDEVAQTIEQSDFLLFPEYWLLEDREVDKLVDARFRSIEAYDDGVVLYQSRRLEEPGRRRQR